MLGVLVQRKGVIVTRFLAVSPMKKGYLQPQNIKWHLEELQIIAFELTWELHINNLISWKKRKKVLIGFHEFYPCPVPLTPWLWEYRKSVYGDTMKIMGNTAVENSVP